MTALTLFLDGVLFLFGLTSVLILGRLTRTGGGRGLLFAAAGLVVLSVVHVLETVLGLWGFVGEGPPEIVHRLLVLVAFAWLAFGLRRAGRGIWAHQEQLRATNVRLHEEVEERGRAEAEATFLAYHDKLTGLPNRAAFKRALEAASSDPSKRLFAVFFVDLDSFKLVNDTAGHSAGDEVLITAGERIRLALRPSDFFARTGGDEFTILTGELTEPADALTLANAVVFAMRRPITGREGPVPRSCEHRDSLFSRRRRRCRNAATVG